MAHIPPGRGARAPPSLPSHLIEEILERVATPRDLVRASAVCATFRRLVADASFLCRYRSLHPPLLLGFIDKPYGFTAVEAPHPNAPTAGALARAADFSFERLGGRGSGWYHCDARDGRVLLMCYGPTAGLLLLPEFAVLDPLTRGHTLLPPIPNRLVVPSVRIPPWDQLISCFDAFFVPSGDYEQTQFRVICWAHWVASVFVYSSLSGTWTAGPTANWDALGLNVYPEEGMPWLSSSPSYAYGCFYWKVFTSNKLLKLEVNRMEFSAVSLPPNHENQQFVVVEEAGEGKIGIFSHISGQEIPESLCYSIRQDEGENANEHVMETTIPLPTDHDNYRVVAAGEGYIFLLGSRSISQQGTVVLRGGRLAFFTLEIKTLKIERVCSIRGGLCGHILPYFGFPPFMSPRRI
ncbi:unnamed protein product [Urochloa decumbens]|uniref:F-box domain-containing protein n=1 Tax=Urochloa decumbens TaxID=240449 RepID=A0ABC8W6K5_9POAL